MPFENEHHLVATADAKTEEVSRCTVGLLLETGKGGLYLLTTLTGPEKRKFVRCFLCPFIHDIISEVESIRDFEMQMLSEIFL